MVPGKAAVTALAEAEAKWRERYQYEVKTSVTVGTPRSETFDEHERCNPTINRRAPGGGVHTGLRRGGEGKTEISPWANVFGRKAFNTGGPTDGFIHIDGPAGQLASGRAEEEGTAWWAGERKGPSRYNTPPRNFGRPSCGDKIFVDVRGGGIPSRRVDPQS
ncbi:orotidine-5'-phosphate decarboxylase [Verticillium alfalfae VaMs.102]|uniref:Orotidine-5'-phosphate decarboxylase n=1 Tax=Verticillium alfalfae (strain VaMs.102 / ATCC MYA-4576 / FGSC 10136) TaxID=526221 RepID=C9SKN6_VERA1|nr:orotidine-5'-phosphate decarboxylase [Verticillium alfalfae VaMs.102]EEY19254.1 orotidine-5'-phosphate decarboxylase [Verticillium alfalfae VaMs.102]